MARLAPLILLCACGDLYVDVSIDADPCTAELIDRLVVRVLDEAGDEVGVFEPEEVVFPTGVRLISSEASRRWEVRVEAQTLNGVPFSFQRATGDFEVTSRALLLDDRCMGVECSDGTCIAGTCSTEAFETLAPNPEPSSCPLVRYADASAGSGTPCGTQAGPCASAQDVLDALEPVGGVAFLSGTFSGGSGSRLLHVMGSNVAVRPWPGRAAPIVDGTGAHDALEIDGVDIVVDGIEVRNGKRHGISINGDENLRVTVRNCDLHDNGDVYEPEDMFPTNHAAVSINNGASEILVEHNFIHDNISSMGMRLSGVMANLQSDPDRVGSATIRNNRIIRNTSGVFTNNAGDFAHVLDNVIHDTEMIGISFDGGGEVRGNRVCASGDHGIVVRADASVSFNSVVDSNNAGIRLVGDHEWVVARNIIAHNGFGLQGQDGADPMDGPNLYFMNGVQFDEITPDMVDVVANPMFVMRDDCSLDVAPGSPALEGEGFGAR